jgi:hypothetical protein
LPRERTPKRQVCFVFEMKQTKNWNWTRSYLSKSGKRFSLPIVTLKSLLP